jgi:hypothetical protein
MNVIVTATTGEFTIESGVSEYFPGPGQMALGWFTIRIRGTVYGVKSPDATLLACSYDSVCERIRRRGSHDPVFSEAPSDLKLASSVYCSLYQNLSRNSTVLGLPHNVFVEQVNKHEIIWAPDGDQAFDDSSFVLHFDVGNQVRLIGFRVTESGEIDREQTSGIYMAQEEFYQVLVEWKNEFWSQWMKSRSHSGS